MKNLKRALLLAISAGLLAWGGASHAASSGYIESSESAALLARIKPGVTTAEEVRQLLGPPANTMHFPGQGYDAMQYNTYGRAVISVNVGADGKVRDVQTIRAPSF
ncbi:MAG: hypothetical protein ACRET8_06480 [Burkholderiales bacterium]